MGERKSKSDNPILDSVADDLQWHPVMLRPTFDVRAAVAASHRKVSKPKQPQRKTPRQRRHQRR